MSRYRNEDTAGLWIPGKLPGMNEMIGAAKGMKGRGTLYSNMKREWTDRVCMLAKEAGIDKPGPFQGRVIISFRWFEESRRRDIDNVAAAKKFVIDGLVKAGVISSDGWRGVQSFTDSFDVRPERPGVAVTIQRYPGAVQMDAVGAIE